jgi:regulatory protein
LKNEFENNNDFQLLLTKAKRYCDLQDRSKYEVEKKLKTLSTDPQWISTAAEILINEGYIDEQRFADNFARGRFRIKNWGKMKITAALYQQQIALPLINRALDQIDDTEYRQILADLLRKKWKLTTGNTSTRINKTASYAIAKGFESPLVFEIIKSIHKEL